MRMKQDTVQRLQTRSPCSDGLHGSMWSTPFAQLPRPLLSVFLSPQSMLTLVAWLFLLPWLPSSSTGQGGTNLSAFAPLVACAWNSVPSDT